MYKRQDVDSLGVKSWTVEHIFQVRLVICVHSGKDLESAIIDGLVSIPVSYTHLKRDIGDQVTGDGSRVTRR